MVGDLHLKYGVVGVVFAVYEALCMDFGSGMDVDIHATAY